MFEKTFFFWKILLLVTVFLSQVLWVGEHFCMWKQKPWNMSCSADLFVPPLALTRKQKSFFRLTLEPSSASASVGGDCAKGRKSLVMRSAGAVLGTNIGNRSVPASCPS